MSNRIVTVEVLTHRLEPFEAELWVIVNPEFRTPTTEVRGRFVGPKSAVSSTIEVAYPLRPLPRQPEGLGGVLARVVIPEPSLWEPACPFIYDGVVELWEENRRCDLRQVPGFKLLKSNVTSLQSRLDAGHRAGPDTEGRDRGTE
jgi:hypothetical protein